MRTVVLVIALVTATAATGAPVRAPLPAHFVGTADHEADTSHVGVPDQRGLYARGVADELWSRENDGVPCVGSETERDKTLAALPDGGMSEFWFYATRSQGILLTRTARLNPKQPCAVALSYIYSVERAFVADGFIHSLSVDSTNGMDPIGSSPTTSSAGEYSSGFERLHSLMARPISRHPGRKKGRDVIAGVAATCRGTSGLVWSTVCTADSGPARGMILRAQAGDDERMSFTTEIRELRGDVLLPGAVFEIDRTWTGKD